MIASVSIQAKMASNDPPATQGTSQGEGLPDVDPQLIQPSLQPNHIAHPVPASPHSTPLSNTNTSVTSTPVPQQQESKAGKRGPSSLESTTTTRRRSKRRTSNELSSSRSSTSSIRHGALKPSLATGSQNSVSSTLSYYNPNYRRERKRKRQQEKAALALSQSQSQSQLNDEDEIMGHYHNTQDPPDSPNATPAVPVHTGPTPPSQPQVATQPTPTTNEALCRLCVCDGPSIPPECAGCNIESLLRCRLHRLRQCQNNQCNKMFHVQCLRNLGWLDNDYYECMECATKFETDDPLFDELEGSTDTRKERLLRIGMAYPTTEPERVAAMK